MVKGSSGSGTEIARHSGVRQGCAYVALLKALPRRNHYFTDYPIQLASM